MGDCNSIQLADRIAQCCIEKYYSLAGSGQPKKSKIHQEFTILAGFALEKLEGNESKFQCISLGTGVKCLSESKIAFDGTCLNDSHAEVLAKRGLMRFLWDQLESSFLEESEFFDKCIIDEEIKLKFKKDVRLHFYISQAPCGDGSMEELDKKTLDKVIDKPIKKQKNDNQSNLIRGRNNFDCLGAIRTKPGRMDSEPTSCMSCSDKIAKWNTLGYQGSLLSDFILPIFPITIVVGELFNPISLKRALIDRIEGIKHDNYVNCNVPSILHTSFNFKFGKYYLLDKSGDDIIIKPSEVALSWVESRIINLNDKTNSKRVVEILINGRKQGAAINKKSGKYSLKTRSNLCKAIFLNKYLQNLKALQDIKFNGNKEILVNSKDNETEYHITKANYEKERKKSYAEIKRDIENKQGLKSIYEKRRAEFFKCSPFDEWKFTGENQTEYNKFMIEE